MCGILLVKSKQELPLEQHLRALSILKSRGPDRTRYQYENGIFIAQVVLHITGTVLNKKYVFTKQNHVS